MYLKESCLLLSALRYGKNTSEKTKVNQDSAGSTFFSLFFHSHHLYFFYTLIDKVARFIKFSEMYI